jgi:hypothetical protein
MTVSIRSKNGKASSRPREESGVSVFAYAFKNAARSAELDGAGLGRVFDDAIARVTGGKYCHVEAWLSGSINSAVCYSARQPSGTAIAIIDLSDDYLWRIVPVTVSQQESDELYGYAVGGSGRPYNMAGIVGIGTDTKISVPWERFCSQECMLMGQKLIGALRWLKDVDAAHVAPSGSVKGGYGFYELLTGAQKL